MAGVVAANLSGPRRRFHGTARDFIIGMQFATVDGKLVQSGGMVVKNVAGLDMAKLFTGSWGTLGAIAIDRSPRNGETDRKSFVDSMITLFIENEELVIVIWPEGTMQK